MMTMYQPLKSWIDQCTELDRLERLEIKANEYLDESRISDAEFVKLTDHITEVRSIIIEHFDCYRRK